MVESLQAFLEQQPMLALFFTIALGYLVGEINVKGFALGGGAVLFVALAVGWFAPKAVPAPMIGALGLALFLYTVGIQYGKQFFTGLVSAEGVRANLLALTGVLLSGLICIVFWRALDMNLGHALGLFAGSGTSTPTLQAALTALGNDDPAVGYGVAYPFGVAGPILMLYVTFLLLKPQIEAAAGASLALKEARVRHAGLAGKPLADVMVALPSDVQIVALRRADRNQPAIPNTVLALDDILLAVGPNEASLAELVHRVGEEGAEHVVTDRRDLDYLRVFASKASVVGRPLADLALPSERASMVIQVRRGDTDLLPHPDLVLEYGDRIGLLANRADFPALRRFFGDSIKGSVELSYIAIGIGMAAGFFAGALAVPIPGVGKIAFGFAGLLLVALILGNVQRTGGLSWSMPLSANLVLRNLGVTLFLAQAGMAAGPKFVSTVSETGFLMLGLGAIATAMLIVPILLIGLGVLKMPYEVVAGIAAGSTGNPAIFTYAAKLAPSERVDLGYAMIFPGMTIIKMLFVNVVHAVS
jgi:putative transport protein